MAHGSKKSVLFWINIILIIILIALASFIGWKQYLQPYLSKNNSNKTQPTAKVENNLDTTAPLNSKDSTDSISANGGDSTQTNTDLTYTNTKYGFTLTLPSTWNGYKVTQTNDLDSTDKYEFSLPTTDPTWVDGKFASQAILVVYTPAQWQLLQQSNGPVPTLIDQSSQYVFAYSSAQAEPNDLIDRLPEVAQIIKTFKLNQ